MRGESGEGVRGEIRENYSIRHVSGKALLRADPPDSGSRADALRVYQSQLPTESFLDS